MPNYVNKSLVRFQHLPSQKWQDQPYPHVKPTYGVKTQYSQKEDYSPVLDKAGKEIYSGVMWSISFPGTCGQQRTTPSAQLSCFPTGKPKRENNRAM